jgi:hypothetical protein
MKKFSLGTEGRTGRVMKLPVTVLFLKIIFGKNPTRCAGSLRPAATVYS